MSIVGRDGERFVVRLPRQTRDKLTKMARENLRSMNSEIVYHLERAINLREKSDSSDKNGPQNS